MKGAKVSSELASGLHPATRSPTRKRSGFMERSVFT